MIYRGHIIQARIETWDTYEINDNGELGEYVTSGGGDTDYPLFDVWTAYQEDTEMVADECLIDTLNSVKEAKKYIDEQIKNAVAFKGKT